MNAGRRVILPEIADYEIRRELIRIQSHSALMLLNLYGTQLEYLPLNTLAMQHAADLWAQARNSGQPTASASALDCDVILAAQTLTLAVPAIIATTNIAHLSRFTQAELQGYRTINALDFACFLVFYLKSQATIGFDRQNSRFSRENIVR
jgi:predicted nucleic acid-binding protein